MIREICRGFVYVYSTRVAPRVKNLHGIGISWRIRTSISMEFHGNFSMGFHGKYLHGGLGHFPRNSMAKVAMEDYDTSFHGIPWKFLHQYYFPWRITTFSMEFHGNVPCNSIKNYSIDYSMDLQGVDRN